MRPRPSITRRSRGRRETLRRSRAESPTRVFALERLESRRLLTSVPVTQADYYVVDEASPLQVSSPWAPVAGPRILQTATVGPTGWTGGYTIASMQFLGARFSVAAPLRTARVGGNLGGTGQVFAAIVALSGPDDFPDSSDLSTPDVVGHALLTLPGPATTVVRGTLTTELSAGWYALIFGSGRFGADGDGFVAWGGSGDFELLSVDPSHTGSAPRWKTQPTSGAHFFLDRESAPAGILANDNDADGDPLSAQLVTAPTHGELDLHADGTFRYQPQPSFAGLDWFLYRASDGDVLSPPTAVALAVGDAGFQSQPDTYQMMEDEILEVPSVGGLLVNDRGPGITAQLVIGPAHGQLELRADGSFTYRPRADFAGQDRFLYRIDNVFTATAPTAVTIQVRELEDAPVTVEDRYQMFFNTILQAGFGELASTAVYWADSNSLRLGRYLFADDQPQFLFSAATHPYAVAVDQVGGWLYYSLGPADYKLYRSRFDGSQRQQLVSFTPKFNCPNCTPWLTDLVLDVDNDWMYFTTINHNNSIDGSVWRAHLNGSNAVEMITGLQGPFSIDLDRGTNTLYWSDRNAGKVQRARADGGPVQDLITGLESPQGIAMDAMRGQLFVAAGPGYGPGRILRASLDGSQVQTILSDQPAERMDLAVDASQSRLYWSDSYQEGIFSSNLTGGDMRRLVGTGVARPNGIALDGRSANNGIAGLLSNDHDADGDPLTVALVAGPQHGQLTLNPDGSFVYQPNTGFFGTDEFSYQARDPVGSSPVTRVVIEVTAATARDDSYTMPKNGVLELNFAAGLLANDTVTGLSHVGLEYEVPDFEEVGYFTQLSADGSFRFVPLGNFVGNVQFTYRIVADYDPDHDSGTPVSEWATVTIQIVDDAGPVGSIAGSFWEDINADGLFQPELGEMLLLGQQVFVDRNINGIIDPADLLAVTDSEGHYRFDDLPPGVYAVSAVAQRGWEMTTTCHPDASLPATVPANLANNEGGSSSVYPFSLNYLDIGRRYQQHYAAADFAHAGTIDQIRFRRDGSMPVVGESLTVDLRVRLAYSATSGGPPSPNFDHNILGQPTTVFDGVVVLEGSELEGDGPNPFDVLIDVDDAFYYEPSRGDLLLDLEVRSVSDDLTLDAATGGTTTRVWELGGQGVVGFAGSPDGYGLVTQFQLRCGASGPSVRVPVRAWQTTTDVNFGARRLPLTEYEIRVSTTEDELDGDLSDGDVSLREAIVWANQLIGHPRIMVPAGHYRLSQTGPDEDASATGDLDLTNTLGITRIVGAGPSQTVIDGLQTDRVLDGAPAIRLELSDLAIINGRAETGGGIRVLAGGRLATSRVRIADNLAAMGGGLYAAGAAEVRLDDTTMADNSADQGGGIMTSGTDGLSVQRSLLRANRAVVAGGAIYSFEDDGPVHILETWIADNTAGRWGGGVHLDDSQAIVERSTLSGNVSGDRGGGLSAWEDATLTLLSSTLSGNRARNSGGGLYYEDAVDRQSIQILHSTITANVADEDGDGHGRGGGLLVGHHDAAVELHYSIVAGNFDFVARPGSDTTNLKPDDIRGSVSWHSSYNLVGVDRQLGLMNGMLGNRLGSIRHPLNPGLGPLADNGGPTPTHELLPGSPAIDFGRGAGAGPRPWPATDQRGLPRVVDGNGDGRSVIDAGAGEHQLAPPLVGDFNQDRRVDATDIDLLCAAIAQGASPSPFDLRLDGRLDREDVNQLVRGILHTDYGDANLDGRFNSADLVQVLQSGKYEDSSPGSATWAEGDWNGDGKVTSEDLLLALQSGKYL